MYDSKYQIMLNIQNFQNDNQTMKNYREGVDTSGKICEREREKERNLEREREEETKT